MVSEKWYNSALNSDTSFVGAGELGKSLKLKNLFLFSSQAFLGLHDFLLKTLQQS
jgi:hypothetical protein